MAQRMMPKPPPSAAKMPQPAGPIEFVTGPIDLLPVRAIITAVEGWGKTSMAAHMPNPVCLMAREETGYDTLLSRGLVPDIPRLQIDSWDQTITVLRSLASKCDFDTVFLDAAAGFERLLHEHVCERDFKGEWGEKGFAAFARGYDRSVTDWLELLGLLGKIHQSGAHVVILSHCAIVPFSNPEGEDYSRYTSDVHKKTWKETHKWADLALFGDFVTEVTKGKAAGGGSHRVLYAERSAVRDAKNRYNLPKVINMTKNPAESWPTVWNLIKGEK